MLWIFIFIIIFSQNTIPYEVIFTESEILTPDAEGCLKQPCSDPIKPHEQRALNFLINEYLLMYGFKLTSITFSDENENQVRFSFIGKRLDFNYFVYLII